MAERAPFGGRLNTPGRGWQNMSLSRMSVDSDTFGRMAEWVARIMGTARFLLWMTVFVIVWITLNVVGLFGAKWDPYQFILLNLAFSTQAAYAAPLILLAGNRSSTRDRLTLEHAAAEADVEEAQNERLLQGNAAILARIETLEERILSLEKVILERLGDPGKGA